MAGECILVVDDNEQNVKLITFLLLAAGFEVHSAPDALAALALLTQLSPALLLLDLQMPGMSGIELAQQLKQEPRTRDIPIVLLTASAMKGEEQRARDAGCDGYISKPINTREFASQVMEYLAPAGPPAAPP
jgi:two-component system, cell cycle response regulator DivK